jgi:hypothetical protein
MNKEFAPLTPDDIAQLDALLGTDGRFTSLFASWTKLANEISDVYADVVDEYFNDVAYRTEIQEALEKLPAAVASRLQIALSAPDKLFIEKTERLNAPFWSGKPEGYFWCHRIPKNVAPQFASAFSLYRVVK